MKKVCQEVRDNYSLYEQLLLGSKQTEGRDVYVGAVKPSSPRWKVDRLPIEHTFDPRQVSALHTEISCYEEKNFKFLLFAHDFMPAPLVNYDSQGATHRNGRDVPFAQQAVTTPHFNRYDERGHRYAYKSAALNDPEASAQLTNVTTCIIHFYDEFNIRHIPAGYPSVFLRAASQQDLFPTPINDDPLAHVARF